MHHGTNDVEKLCGLNCIYLVTLGIAQSLSRLGYCLNDRGVYFDTWQETIFPFPEAPRPARRPIQTSFKGTLESFSSKLKRPRREAGDSSPTTFELKTVWSYTSIPTM